MKTLIALLAILISTSASGAVCVAVAAGAASAGAVAAISAHNKQAQAQKQQTINYPVYLTDTEELKKLPPEDVAGLKRAAGKCYKNVRLVAPHKVEGDWVCAPPRAATPEEQNSKTEK